jgi:hypothetical protein
MARTVYITTELQGGGSGLDGINGNSLVKGDMAFYLKKNTTGAVQGHSFLVGTYMASSRGSTVAMGSTEDQPNFIKPDSNGANWIWGLSQALTPVFYTTGLTAIIPNYGVSIIRTETNTVHWMRRPKRGVIKKIVFLTTAAVKIRLSSGAAAYTVKASSQAVVLVAPTTRLVWSKLQDGAAAIELVGRTTARWDIINMFAATTSPKGNITFSSST